MKPPVQFLDLNDLERITPSGASSTFAILDPVITIERNNGKLEVAARFNLEVKPYPVFSREDNKKWPHARFIDCVRLTHIISGDASLTFEPLTSEQEAYTVTESTEATGSLTAGGGISGLVPSANVAISIVKGGKIEVVSKISPWTCNASREPRTEEDTRQRFSWEWISNMGENPTIPDTALRGMKWPVTLGTSEEAMAARRLMASIIRFDFSIEIHVRELGYGGFLAHWEKWVHWLRPYQHPKRAYDTKRNRGRPLSSCAPESFCLGPQAVANFTEADLDEIKANLGAPGMDTDSLQDVKMKAYEEYARTGSCPSHISPYIETHQSESPSVIKLAQGIQEDMVNGDKKRSEGKTKVAYIPKTW